MYKEISFEVGTSNSIRHGTDVTRKDDRKIVFDYKGQPEKYNRIKDVLEGYKSGNTKPLPDIGRWWVYYNSILPIQLEALHGDPWKHIENKYDIPETYIDTIKHKFVYTSENTDSLIFSGVLFDQSSSGDTSLDKRFEEKYGKKLSITRNKVYLTGIKIIEE